MNSYQQQEYGQQSQPTFCKICGRVRCGPNSIWNSIDEPCHCTPAELQQLTEADVRRIIREEIAVALAQPSTPH